jgi:hypothetical protein
LGICHSARPLSSHKSPNGSSLIPVLLGIDSKSNASSSN